MGVDGTPPAHLGLANLRAETETHHSQDGTQGEQT